jgi:hypothetical protein
MNDLRMMEETKECFRQLKEECSKKDGEIRRQADTITTLSSMKRRIEEKIERQKEEIEQEKQKRKEDKAKSGKKVAAAVAEEKLKLGAEFDKLLTEHGQSYNKSKK